ncbi:hypothetical protein INT45_009306 [Circinella minor]|uniref:PH domain-containing protein n=1 Tax=Circinella minor TaxID=1195481 RepID=A0A8H7VBN7_9FUNG|nr:hypothetical protein INT45_009306 [Circinella minor]
MTTFKAKQWTLRNNNTVLPIRSPTSSDTTSKTTKTTLSSPALSDRHQHRSGILQLHYHPSTYLNNDNDFSTSSTKTTPTSSALKRLIPSISSLNFPIKVTTDEMNSDTNNESKASVSEEQPNDDDSSIPMDTHTNDDDTSPDNDPPIFDCDDEEQNTNDHKYNHILLEQNDHRRGIRPVQILTERLEAWYMLIKELYHHFIELANVENQVSKAYIRLLQATHLFGTTLSSSSETSNSKEDDHHSHQQQQSKENSSSSSLLILLNAHFNTNSNQGIRNVCRLWQERYGAIAKGHGTLSAFIKANVLPSLSSMKRELKGMIRSIRMDDRLKLSKLAQLRREAKRRVLRLDRQLAFFEHHPHHGDGKQDPWLINTAVVNQMLKVYHQTNKMHETVFRLQKEVMISEQRIVQEFRQLCQDMITIQEQQTCLGIDSHLQHIIEAIDQLQADDDWNYFVNRFKQHLIPEQARYRHPNQLQYPNHAHPLLQPIFAARMERNSSLLHRWHEHIYVLTPAGFLHEYRNASSYPTRPDTTIFVPHYNVSTLSTNLHHNLIFQLQRIATTNNIVSLSRTNTTSSASSSASVVSSSSLSSAMPNKRYYNFIKSTSSKTLTFRAKSAPDMQAWLEHLTELSYRYRPSVSYNAPPFLQPSNATNPECFVSSPSSPQPQPQPQPPQQQNEESAIKTSTIDDTNDNTDIPLSSAEQQPVVKVVVDEWDQKETKSKESWCQDNPWNDNSCSSTITTVQKESPTIGLPSFISGCIAPPEPPSITNEPTPEKEQEIEIEKKNEEEKNEEIDKKEEQEVEEPRKFFLTGVTLPDSMK